MADEKEYGSLGRLAPEWDGDERERNLTADDIYERFFGWVEEVKGIEPWPHQEEAIMDLLAGDHVILNTPTGSGKSLVALGMHFAALCTGRRSYYTAPIKALVSEKFFDLVEVFGRDNVGMITGDSHINADAPIICCTAEILANQALREGTHADVGLVAMDEFHYYGDPERGWAWQVPLLTLPQTQFLLMSATLGNVDAIADKLSDLNDTPDVDVIADAPRPVPLSYEYTLDPLERTVELAFRNGETPIYVVHFSQDAALETAQALASTGVSSKEQRQAIAEAIKGVKFTTAFGKILQRLLRTGVGIHHAGMLPRYRRLVEQLAQQGLLPVICGTDTLGVGINVPIHSVVLTALTKFDGTKMRRLRAREFHQIAGRAGRMGFDTEGLVVAEAPEYEIENQKAIAKAGGDPKKLKKVKRKKAPEGFVTWNEGTFNKLIDAAPETLVPHLKITHSMVIHRLDPRVKMVGFLAAMFTMFAVNTPVQLVLGLMVTLAVIAAARLNPLWVLKSIHPLLMLMLLMGIVNLFVVRTGTPVVALGPLSITDQGVTIAVLYTCRFMLVIILGTVFLTTTTPTAMTDAFAALIKPLNRLGVHAQEIALVMSLALRFIPTLTDETRAIIDAQSARGGSIETGSLGQRIKAMSAIIVPTFAGTLRHADNLSLALDARCYEEGIHRTHWRALSIAGRDIVFAALVIAYIASIILL